MVRVGRAIQLGRSRAFRSPVAARHALRSAVLSMLSESEHLLAEHQFATEAHLRGTGFDPRRFRFDLAIPARYIAIEFQGFHAGGHAGAAGFRNDCMKFCLAAAMGWIVFPIAYEMIYDTRAFPKVLAMIHHSLTQQRDREKALAAL